ncbi:uncharacterized protein LOC119370449 [Jatropha curcas]|uniref:uncharacterized protein LOC119370449 n=1 Tax=Jatropha curcas TaxID=180498 RepID=UPI0018949418|nr:uncharacterized protein LOC119370449 [Jatropha curcas]
MSTSSIEESSITPSASSTTPALVSSSSTSVLASFLNVPNVSDQLTVKLTSSNYILCKTLLLPILRGYNLEKHIDSTFTPPPLVIDNSPNPAFTTWYLEDQIVLGYLEDQIVLGWINSSLTEPLLNNVVGVKSALEAWKNLEASFAAGSRTQVRAISEDDFIGAILDGLGPDYRPFTRSVEARLQPITYEDLRGLLLAEEQLLKKHEAATTVTIPATALYSNRETTSRQNNNSSRGRGGRSQTQRGGRSYNGSNRHSRTSSSGGPVVCYNCNGTGHMSRQCPSPRNSPQVHHTFPYSSQAQPWIVLIPHKLNPGLLILGQHIILLDQ